MLSAVLRESRRPAEISKVDVDHETTIAYRRPGAFHSGFTILPPPARDMQRLHCSSARHYRSRRDELIALPTSLGQARSFRHSVTGPGCRHRRNGRTGGMASTAGQDGGLSTNSSHRVFPDTHDALVSDQATAHTSSHAILDVVTAVPSGAFLEHS